MKKVSSSETTVFVYDGSGQLVAEYSTALAQTPQVSYLTQDHLGSPRVVTDQNGVVTSRKDFTAFGEESVTPQRTQALKYQPPGVRQDYTGYQKDDESGLEFAQARYYNSTHGRFTSVDPLMASANVKNPQTLNRYSYVLNSPYKFNDPLGLISASTGACGQWCQNSIGGFVDGSSFRGRDATLDGLKTRTELLRAFVNQIVAALGIAEGRKAPNQQSDRVKVVYNPTVYQYAEVSGATSAQAADRAGDATTGQFGCPAGNGGGCTSPYFKLERTKFGFTITVSITVYLTRWTGYDKASEFDRDQWDRYASRTKRHEEVHVGIFRFFDDFLKGKIPASVKTTAQLKEHPGYRLALDKIYVFHDVFDDFDVSVRSQGYEIDDFFWRK